MKLYNTLSREVDQLTPLTPDKVTLYTCGLTVYSQPHIGNWVSYIYWDILVRTLQAEGYSVDRVQNITDVGHLTDDGDAGEDKMQKGALREGKTAWDVAEKYIAIADHEAYEVLGLIRPTHMPRATDYVLQQIEFVKLLEEKGYTYRLDDGIYYDTSKFPDYGKMARLDIAGLEFGARVADSGKKNPTDFALWKFSPSDQKRDMEWESTWGTGFPGWHLECSVMARELLGDQIDIHTGGIDHIPVHHTNEIAQTEAVTGKQFVQQWIHANHIKVDGKKMSKSLGNIITLDDITSHGYPSDAFKLLVLSKHYRTEGNFTWEILDAASNRLHNWRNYAALRHQTHDTLQSDEDKSNDEHTVALYAGINAMREALSDDIGTPEALKVIDESFARFDNHPLQDIHQEALEQFLEAIRNLLGIDLIASTPDINDKQKQLILEREQARNEKDWGRSDDIRDQLLEQGITLRDSTHGVIWAYAR